MGSRRYSVLAVSIIILLAFACTKNNSSKLNLDFEQIDSKTGKHAGWQIDIDQNYNIGFDSKTVHSGKYSLKIENISKYTPDAQVKEVYLIITNSPARRSIKLSGFIKNENTKSDSMGIFIMPYSEGYSRYIFLKNKNFIGTHDWQEYSLELTLNKESDRFLIGGCLIGKGKVWIDDLKLFVDGKQVKFNSTLDFVADHKQIKWLQKNCIKIKSVQAECGLDDLQELKNKIANARIVGLGENTHGTSEVFKMKHRLVEFLATEMGFTVFSIEANMPEAYKLNDYVLYGKGDARALLKGMYFWTWNTQEVLDMIEWMRKFNLTAKTKLQFTGFDMQFYSGPIENLDNYSKKYDRLLKAKLDSLSELFEKLKLTDPQSIKREEIAIYKQKSENILAHLTKHRARISKELSEHEFNWLYQNATILLQFAELLETQGRNRDECMARNVDWILDNNPSAKIVLWAHNGHIRKAAGWMGNYLSEKYGHNYYNIGFLSNSGTYTAWNSQGLTSTNKLEESMPGSYEFSFHKTAIPIFFFDFNNLNENEPEGKWLNNILNCRSIGAVAEAEQFMPTRISSEFNAIIYIDATHSSHCFNIQ